MRVHRVHFFFSAAGSPLRDEGTPRRCAERIRVTTMERTAATPREKPAAWIHGAPLLAAVLWGGIYPGVKIGLLEIPVLSFTYLRIVLATAVFAAASARGPWPETLTRRLWTSVIYAGLSQAAFQILLVGGLGYTSAGVGAILLATSPLLTAGWMGLRGKERLGLRRWGGLVLGACGIALVIGAGGATAGSASVPGAALAIGAAAAWACYSLAIGPIVGAVGTLRATGMSMAMALLLFTPISLRGVEAMRWGTVSWHAWAGLAYGATGGMVVAMALWGRSIHRLGPTQTMVYAYVEPVSAVVIAALLLGEALSLRQAVGALVTFAGIWLASERRAQAVRAPTADA
jgi:DME family drug/metabolite transporter